MDQSKVTTHPTHNVIRWTARVVSILFLAVFILMFLMQGLSLNEITPREWVSLFFFPFGASLGMILAWWQEGLGGAITVVSVFLSILVHDPSSGGGYMLACASPGLLFLFSWVLSLSTANLTEDLHEERRTRK
jgi:hypothetical protein